MKKHIITTLSIAALLVLPQAVFGGEKGEKGGEGPFGGKITAVAEGTITVTNKKSGDKTFKTDAATKYVKSDKTDAAATDLKVGSTVRVKAGAAPDQAATIILVVPPAKDPAKEGKNAKTKEGATASGKKDSKDSVKETPKETPAAAPKETPKEAPKEAAAAPASSEKPAN